MDKAATQPYLFQGFKRFILFVFPALGAIYFFCSSFFNYSRTEWVFGILAILNLGCLFIFELSKKCDGQLVIFAQEEKRVFSLNLDLDPMAIEKKKYIIFEVITDQTDEYSKMTQNKDPESQTKHVL